MRSRNRFTILFACLLLCSATAVARPPEFKGTLSGLFLHADNGSMLNFRALPGCSYDYQAGDAKILNAEVYLHARYDSDFSRDDAEVKLYRAILRYTTEQSELQLGLQKINFGPAQVLRSLMWFDSVDPRDPLKLTEGVYGLRYKYSFIDNTNVWLWGLLGNRARKGIETLASKSNQPEFGGRLQFPVLSGEAGATAHTRVADAGTFTYRENRFALDGKFDIGAGVWIEAVLQKSVTDLLPHPWTKMFTLGSDYTLPVGNGVYVMLEHFLYSEGTKPQSAGFQRRLTSLMVNFQLTLLDSFSMIEYYDWINATFYQYYQLQRNYDAFSLAVSLFHYPVSGKGALMQGPLPAAGYGFQLITIYNF